MVWKCNFIKHKFVKWSLRGHWMRFHISLELGKNTALVFLRHKYIHHRMPCNSQVSRSYTMCSWRWCRYLTARWVFVRWKNVGKIRLFVHGLNCRIYWTREACANVYPRHCGSVFMLTSWHGDYWQFLWKSVVPITKGPSPWLRCFLLCKPQQAV